MKSQFLPLFNINFSQLQLNSISTKFLLNLISTLFQPQAQINLNSTTTITSTQYGCDKKATQSCSIYILMFKRMYNESYKSRDSFFRKISNTKLTYSRLYYHEWTVGLHYFKILIEKNHLKPNVWWYDKKLPLIAKFSTIPSEPKLDGLQSTNPPTSQPLNRVKLPLHCKVQH